MNPRASPGPKIHPPPVKTVGLSKGQRACPPKQMLASRRWGNNPNFASTEAPAFQERRWIKYSTMHPYVSGIKVLLEKNKVPDNIAPMKKYMRDQFDFFGIKSTPRRVLCMQYLKSQPLPEGSQLRKIVKELWQLPEREFQYFAIELMIKTKKSWTENDAVLIEYLVTLKSWWDTVDFLSTWVAGPWLQLFPHQIKPLTKKWNQSDNIWLNRVSLLFQLKFKKQTDLVLLTKYIQNLSESDEFFIQKAIGWVLREYSKTDPKWVKNFVKENNLKPLSKREALKVMVRGKVSDA